MQSVTIVPTLRVSRSDMSSEEEPVACLHPIPNSESSLSCKVKAGLHLKAGVSPHRPPCCSEGTVPTARQSSPGLPTVALSFLSLTGTLNVPSSRCSLVTSSRAFSEVLARRGVGSACSFPFPHTLHSTKHGVHWSTVDIKACLASKFYFFKAE